MSRNSPSSSVSVVAAIGSVSYGVLPAERLLAIIAGESAPDDGERARLYQAISESEPHLLYDLAEEAGVTADAFDRRIVALLGVSMKDINPWLNGALY
jgi:hypothetical protein